MEQETTLSMYKPCSILYFLNYIEKYFDENLKNKFYKSHGLEKRGKIYPFLPQRIFRGKFFRFPYSLHSSSDVLWGRQ